MLVPGNYKKTRIAPTPSGFLHLGNVLSFSVTAALARQSGAKILLRIDDLDRVRVNDEYLHDIFDTLIFLDIPWDEGPRDAADFEENYSQIHRMHLYNEVLQQLKDNGRVYACGCSRKQLAEGHPCNCAGKKISLDSDNVSWRLIIDNKHQISVKNYNGTTINAFLPAEMDNFVVRKKDGFPAYQLTSIVDDLFFGVDLVVRGKDLWPSTLAQHQLALALGNNAFNDIAFYHHAVLTGPSGNKLSKSAGATSVKYLRESGRSESDIFTTIASMLWVNGPVEDWQQLAGIVIEGNLF